MWGPPESEPAGRSASLPLTRRSQRGRRPRVTDARGPGSASPADAHHREALRAAGLLRARREAAGRGRHPEHVLHLVRLQLQRPRPRELEEAPVFPGMEPRPAGLAGSSGDRRGPRLRDGVPPPSARTVPAPCLPGHQPRWRGPHGTQGDPKGIRFLLTWSHFVAQTHRPYCSHAQNRDRVPTWRHSWPLQKPCPPPRRAPHPLGNTTVMLASWWPPGTLRST